MKNVFKSLIAAVVVLASVVPALAVSESAVLFLQISPGARAAGMGEAFVALADDATAVYYNPAGLGFQRGKEITLMHTNWLPQLGTDLFYEFGAYRHHFENIGTIGINVTYLNLGTQSRTDESGPDPIGEFSSNEYAVSLTYGTQLSEKWAVGLGARFIQSNLSPFGAGSEEGDGRASAFGFDLATLYKVSSRFSVGANLSNMGPKITYIDAAQADPLPTNLRVGFAAHAINNKYNKLTFVADVNKTMVKRYSDGTSDPFYKAIFTSPWFEEKRPSVKKTPPPRMSSRGSSAAAPSTGTTTSLRCAPVIIGTRMARWIISASVPASPTISTVSISAMSPPMRAIRWPTPCAFR